MPADLHARANQTESMEIVPVLRYNKMSGAGSVMKRKESRYDDVTGRPADKSYFERGLPEYLEISLSNMKESWKIEDSGKRDIHWDLYWCELNADLNSAEVDGVISSEQAWYLREKYLRMKKGE